MSNGNVILAIVGILLVITALIGVIYGTYHEWKYGEVEEHNKCVIDCSFLGLEYASITSGKYAWQKQCICRTDDGDIRSIW